MKGLLTVLSVGMLIAGGAHFARYVRARRSLPPERRPIQDWESEGGAVPVGDNRTAAQVAPRDTPPLSPRPNAQ